MAAAILIAILTSLVWFSSSPVVPESQAENDDPAEALITVRK